MRILGIFLCGLLTGCSTVGPNYQLVGVGERHPRQELAVLYSEGVVALDRTPVLVNTGFLRPRTGFLVIKPGVHEIHYQLGTPGSSSGGIRSNKYFEAKPGKTYRLRTSDIPLLGYVPLIGDRSEVVDVTADAKLHVSDVDAAFAAAGKDTAPAKP